MFFLIIEHFHPGKAKALYQRFEERGRLLPEGVTYINSWVTQDLATCYQIMEAPSHMELWEWIGKWSDLADFEIIPVYGSAEAKRRILDK